MHKFEKRDAKSRTLVILAVVGLAAALTVGIFTAVRMIRKPAASKDDPKTGIVYDDAAIEGGWDNLSPEEIAEKLNEKVAEGMINISMNTAPYFEDGKAEGNVMIVNESINNYPQQVEFIPNRPCRSMITIGLHPTAANAIFMTSMVCTRMQMRILLSLTASRKHRRVLFSPQALSSAIAHPAAKILFKAHM